MMALEITADMGISLVTRDHMSRLDTVEKHRRSCFEGSLELNYPKNDSRCQTARDLACRDMHFI